METPLNILINNDKSNFYNDKNVIVGLINLTTQKTYLKLKKYIIYSANYSR